MHVGKKPLVLHLIRWALSCLKLKDLRVKVRAVKRAKAIPGSLGRAEAIPGSSIRNVDASTG